MESIDVSNPAEVSTESLDNANTFENIDEIPSNVEEDEESQPEQQPTAMEDIGEDLEADQQQQFRCDHCNLYFLSKEELDKHEENDHLMDEKSGTEPTKTDEIPLKAESKLNLDDDVSEEDGKKFNCNQCTKSDFHKSDLLRHMKKDHDTFSCDSCSCRYSDFHNCPN